MIHVSWPKRLLCNILRNIFSALNGGFWGPYIEDVEEDGADQNETSDDYDQYYDDDDSFDEWLMNHDQSLWLISYEYYKKTDMNTHYDKNLPSFSLL